LEEIIILKDFLEHHEAANYSSTQEDPYLSPCKDFKSIACLVQKLWFSKERVKFVDPVVRSSCSM
jgi:hypothetical protein